MTNVTEHRNAIEPTAPFTQRVRRWWSVVGVLIGLELRQRVRTTRWKVTLVLSFVVISAVVFGSMAVAVNPSESSYHQWAQNLYAIVLGALLFLGIVLAPTLTATTINGDRKDATLAVVQATPISNWQLALGKLIGNWVCCLALMVVALPYLVWAIIAAPYGFGRGILGVVVCAVLFACYCGIGLGFSALTARPAGSAVLTQATVFFLLLGLPALFGLLYTTTSEDHEVTRARYSAPDGWPENAASTPPTCRDVETTETFAHTERIWWLLAPNPVLIVPDIVAPQDNPEVRVWETGHRPPGPTLLTPIAETLSAARMGPYIDAPRCGDQRAWFSTSGDSSPGRFYAGQTAHERARIGDSWYLGLLANMAFGAIGLTVAARRLRVPARKLPRGVRIA
ncbi:ABC transporter permease subunit [Gordonia sp. ABSL11-1]|uniref:ABC transporter permease n=1 Tax=Gordonia sp. ABSL11-1 TaxID=3053924 RepID=UPI0025738C23|nr:ABC transporter permease subunit [Gordonia sp. ABSL11-1]MDL9948713.1 ABC transporter permease subunit [Gordonia sp. ABSL11-1]